MARWCLTNERSEPVNEVRTIAGCGEIAGAALALKVGDSVAMEERCG